MVTKRRFSRGGNLVKQASRPRLENTVAAAVSKILLEHDPTIGKPALRIAARLAGYISSAISVQTQAVQRALPTIEDDVENLAQIFIGHIVAEAQGRFDPRLQRFKAVPPPAVPQAPLSAASDWAGPVAGPTVIERHFGIPRSTLFRWQKRDEVIALKSGSSRFVFPLKQFVDARPADGIAELIAMFGDHRLAWRWLMAPTDKLGGNSPIDTLLAGKLANVVAAARLTLEEAPDV